MESPSILFNQGKNAKSFKNNFKTTLQIKFEFMSHLQVGKVLTSYTVHNKNGYLKLITQIYLNFENIYLIP